MGSSLNQEKGSRLLWWGVAGSQMQAWDVYVLGEKSVKSVKWSLYPNTLWWAGTVLKRVRSGVRPRGFKSLLCKESLVTLDKLPSFHFPHNIRHVVALRNLPANAGDIRDAGLIPGSERSPERRHGNPLQYSCLENPMDRRAWWVTVHGVQKSQIWYSD